MQQQVSNNTQYIQEDEIDLRELWATIMKYKFKIAAFSFVVTLFAILFALSKPNSYTSKTLLAPQEKSSMPSLGGLSALAGMAGVNLGGGSMDAASSLEATIKDYSFNTMVIDKYKLDEKITAEAMKKNMVFALGSSAVYDMLNSGSKEDEEKSRDEIVYDTHKSLKEIVSFSSDKKTGAITLSATTQDRFLSKELVDIYLQEATSHVRNREMKEVESKIKYYKKELMNTSDVALKEQLSGLLSGLVQKKVLSQASEFYNVSKVTEPTVAYIKDKSKPKRALIVVVAFVTSIILGIFGAFLLEFIRKDEE